jgi:hypothetical protein
MGHRPTARTNKKDTGRTIPHLAVIAVQLIYLRTCIYKYTCRRALVYVPTHHLTPARLTNTMKSDSGGQRDNIQLAKICPKEESLHLPNLKPDAMPIIIKM